MSSLYIHIPFCLSKCPYCSFVSYPGMDKLHQRYVAALLLEAQWLHQNASVSPLSTLFLGGGTPTIFSGRELAQLVSCCQELFAFSDQAEISIEANPKTINPEKLSLLRHSGINRLSIGVQSFNDKELQLLGRPHSAEDAAEAVQLARAAGFDNISLDLMYGLPGQDHYSWQQTLEQAISIAPDHLSLYELTVEQGTPYHLQRNQGLLDLPDEENMVIMDQLTATLCRQAGLAQYEISNYARPGYECRHNINYWQNGPYLALGAGAVGCVDGRRRQKTCDPRHYCEQIESGQSVVQEEECLERTASFRETVVMGLRMTCGVSKIQLQQRYEMDLDDYYGDTLIHLVNQGLVEITASHLRLTARGRSFANQVMAELV
ncbi:MAG: radical SAM family heme chaperone HemW [Proteobacteria bacterium]|jgi:oxygen-independent coproporphyrinogen-3 oxidase|nr:radical SAM family heme chaperone HemW [Desulfocapsa sp.]MBU3946127.1 radical SAM family heme chaperone HemW [Pseudomonadota bacterium]MCG2742362.1 radical SAM family heme chaperone HemW [Desulfobacteraceae bacterium]MBU3981906.1 radical SAM family heme chaperone HemW [Pseudomonadota bacterium]MBU4027330.1 radical SAM family heme chaperone HemW [Pseudomonadota bacterium]